MYQALWSCLVCACRFHGFVCVPAFSAVAAVLACVYGNVLSQDSTQLLFSFMYLRSYINARTHAPSPPTGPHPHTVYVRVHTYANKISLTDLPKFQSIYFSSGCLCTSRVCMCVGVPAYALPSMFAPRPCNGRSTLQHVRNSERCQRYPVCCVRPPLHSRPLPPAWPPLGASLAVFALSLGARCCRPGRGHGRHRAFGDALGCGGGRRGEGDEGKKAEEAVGKEAKREVEGKAEGVC